MQTIKSASVYIAKLVVRRTSLTIFKTSASCQLSRSLRLTMPIYLQRDNADVANCCVANKSLKFYMEPCVVCLSLLLASCFFLTVAAATSPNTNAIFSLVNLTNTNIANKPQTLSSANHATSSNESQVPSTDAFVTFVSNLTTSLSNLDLQFAESRLQPDQFLLKPNQLRKQTKRHSHNYNDNNKNSDWQTDTNVQSYDNNEPEVRNGNERSRQVAGEWQKVRSKLDKDAEMAAKTLMKDAKAFKEIGDKAHGWKNVYHREELADKHKFHSFLNANNGDRQSRAGFAQDVSKYDFQRGTDWKKQEPSFDNNEAELAARQTAASKKRERIVEPTSLVQDTSNENESDDDDDETQDSSDNNNIDESERVLDDIKQRLNKLHNSPVNQIKSTSNVRSERDDENGSSDLIANAQREDLPDYQNSKSLNQIVNPQAPQKRRKQNNETQYTKLQAPETMQTTRLLLNNSNDIQIDFLNSKPFIKSNRSEFVQPKLLNKYSSHPARHLMRAGNEIRLIRPPSRNMRQLDNKARLHFYRPPLLPVPPRSQAIQNALSPVSVNLLQPKRPIFVKHLEIERQLDGGTRPRPQEMSLASDEFGEPLVVDAGGVGSPHLSLSFASEISQMQKRQPQIRNHKVYEFSVHRDDDGPGVVFETAASNDDDDGVSMRGTLPPEVIMAASRARQEYEFLPMPVVNSATFEHQPTLRSHQFFGFPNNVPPQMQLEETSSAPSSQVISHSQHPFGLSRLLRLPTFLSYAALGQLQNIATASAESRPTQTRLTPLFLPYTSNQWHQEAPQLRPTQFDIDFNQAGDYLEPIQTLASARLADHQFEPRLNKHRPDLWHKLGPRTNPEVRKLLAYQN